MTTGRLTTAAIGLLLAGCIQQAAPPVPPVPVLDTVDAAAAASMADYRARSAEVFDALAADLRSGKYTTQTEFADAMEAATKNARLESFAKLREAWQADNGSEWDRDADAAKCELTAKGFRQ